MPKKKEEETNTETNSLKTLIEVANESKENKFIVIGAIANAGKIRQYESEKAALGRFDITPSITQKEFDKYIDDFKKLEV